MSWTTLCSVLFGSVIFISGITGPGYAKGSIEIFTLNTEIEPTDDVFVTGFVNTETFYEPVFLEVYDPNGKLLFNPTINFNDDGQFSWLFHPPLGRYDVVGTYKIIASHKDIPDQDEIQFTVVNLENEVSDSQIPRLNKDSGETSDIFFESFEFGNDNSQIKKPKVTIKTTGTETDNIRNNEFGQILVSNFLGYIIPFVIAIIALFIIIWLKVRSNKTNQINKFRF